MDDRLPEGRRIGQLLVQSGKLVAADLDRALRLQSAHGERLGRLLVRLGIVSDKDVAQGLAEQLSLPLAAAQDFPREPVAVGELAPAFLKKNKVMPIGRDNGRLKLAMADPLDDEAVAAMEFFAGVPVARWVAPESEIATALRRTYDDGTTPYEDIVDVSDVAVGAATDDEARLRDLASEAPVIRLVNLLIARAIEQRASDIHIEPFADRMVIRNRIDGVLFEQDPLPVRMAPAVVSRIKLMSGLNIAERRLAQDGRVRVRVQGRDVDMRVATLPSLHGETVVIRLLETHMEFDFGALGLKPTMRNSLEALLRQPHGMIIATGPTGSGKTTLLYSALQYLHSPKLKILTAEDPVEYQFDGVVQVQVRPQIGLSFANLLRSIVRQDPDVIMIGEMRDLETAQIAVHAALTGHLVLSTLHTNDAAGAVTRLLDMRVADFLIASTLLGVVAQRLVRRLCSHCRTPYVPTVAQRQAMALDATQEPQLFRAAGCDHCASTGYVGRVGVFELLAIDDDVRKLVLEHADAMKIRDAAVRNGMTTIYGDALEKACAGVTTFEEVQRVVRES
ncbi:MAG TPA: ATPase, T2SS/T4P/T4SS family [Steroidobacteraceae bacterium]